jgi:hypothetical protein
VWAIGMTGDANSCVCFCGELPIYISIHLQEVCLMFARRLIEGV